LVKLDPGSIVKAIEAAVPTEAAHTSGEHHTSEEHTTEAHAHEDHAHEDHAETPTAKKIKSQGTEPDRTKLVADLFKDYNKIINPDDVKLGFGVTLIDFHVLEKEDAIESYVWLMQNWTDPRLAWNPEEYGGTEIIRLDSDQVWKPDVTLYNSADPVNMVNCWHSNVLIYSNGNILWIPPCKMTSGCHLNLWKEPYGENTCSFKFGSWTFDGNLIDIGFFKDASMDVSHLSDTSGFEIVKNVAEHKDVYYPCCAEPYPNLTFNLTLKRVSGEELFKRM
jgi:nicotinic acetylcholine receptor